MVSDLEGYLNILKPPGMTSHDVVGYLRRVLSLRRIGHTGTLDPNAAGVLPLCLGRATRLSAAAVDQMKGYRAELTLGTTTDTQDTWGETIATLEPDIVHQHVDKAAIERVVMSFEGKSLQQVPMVSAVRVQGKKLYEWARQSKEIERPFREVTIYGINILSADQDSRGYPRILFDVTCSKGTYIRTLCADIGARLGVGGHLSYLLRTFSGPFTLDEAYTLEEVRDAFLQNFLGELIKPLDYILDNLSPCILNTENTKRFLNGQDAGIIPVYMDEGDLVRVYADDRSFIGLGQIRDSMILPRKVFHKE